MKVKELSDISLHITEPEYRQMPELSYSTLSTYEKTGFDGLDSLFDRKESASLTFGSIVDSIMTGGEDEFKRLFYVVDLPNMDGKEGKAVRYLFQEYGSQYASLEDMPATYILNAANMFEYGADNWKPETKVSKITKAGSLYYREKRKAGDKTLISKKDYEDAKACVRALRESPSTAPYFAEDDELSPFKRYYQLKFRAKIDNVGFRCMADLIIADYQNKKVFPIDLKTSSHTEWNFQDSFLQWQYMIQARLYWRIIRANMNADRFFRDFSLEDYRFIVVNRRTLTPLVWEFPFTKFVGTLIDEKGNQYRDPSVIGKELKGYLDLKPQVPEGINMKGLNCITCLKPA